MNYNYPIMIRDATDEGSTALTIHAIFLSSLIHQFFSLLGSSRVLTLFLENFLREKKQKNVHELFIFIDQLVNILDAIRDITFIKS